MFCIYFLCSRYLQMIRRMKTGARNTHFLSLTHTFPHSFIHTPLFSLFHSNTFSLSHTHTFIHTLSLSVSLSFTLHITVIDNYSLLFSTVTVIDKMGLIDSLTQILCCAA